jgi:glutamate mutase epsilon subunit
LPQGNSRGKAMVISIVKDELKKDILKNFKSDSELNFYFGIKFQSWIPKEKVI